MGYGYIAVAAQAFKSNAYARSSRPAGGANGISIDSFAIGAYMTDPGIDRGFVSLKELAKVYEGLRLADATEADTRAKVIDAILRGVLYWKEDDLTREERASEDGSTQFVDYVLTTATVKVLIEARASSDALTL